MQLRWMGLLTLGACLSASHGTTQTEGDAPVSMRTTSHVESPVTLLSTDVEWMGWADVQNPPPLWPLLELPTETRKLHSLLPEDWKATSDLVVDLGSDPEDLRTSGLWWSGALAPFIGRTPEHYAEEAPRMQAANRRRLRSGRPEFSRTTLVYPVPQGPPVEVNEETHADPVEGGIRTMYFAKSIDVEDPSAFVAL